VSRRASAAATLLAFVSLLAASAPGLAKGSTRRSDLVEIVAIDPTIHLDIRYATPKNFTGRAVYTEARAFLQRPAAEALARASAILKDKGYGLLVFDGYRPWRVTKIFWDITPPEKHTFVADPSKGSKHNRGCAVDLSLYDLKTGAAVEMPSDYDEMSESAYPTYAGGTKEQRDRRDLLRDAMEQAGFFVYVYEWWHFDFKDWLEYPIMDTPFAEIARSAPIRPPIDLSQARVVDLTHAFDASTLYWPNAPGGFELTRLAFGPSPAGFFYAANAFRAPEHGGTHLDAPIHFAEGKATVDKVPPSSLVLPMVVIDVSANAAADADYRLTEADVKAWEERHGRVPPGCAVILRTGWASRWPDRKRTFGDDTPGETKHLHFPAFGAEAARLLVEGRSVALLGLDTPSLDHGPSADFPVHRIAAAANVPGLENLASLDGLPETGAWLVALPMMIAGGSGAPVRAMVLIP